MAADTTTLTEKMRAALRISSTSEKITTSAGGGAAYTLHILKKNIKKTRLYSRLQNGFAGRRRKETGRNRRTDY